jgi:hypothetical protein
MIEIAIGLTVASLLILLVALVGRYLEIRSERGRPSER